MPVVFRWVLPALVLASVSLAGGAYAQAPRDRDSEHGKPFFDSRAGDGDEVPRRASTKRFAERLGAQGVVELDPATGTPRVITKLDGALTGPSEDGATRTALDYVRANAAAFGLSDADIEALRLDDRYTTESGLTILRWTQVTDGVPAFDNGLKIAVDRAGRVLTVSGSPAHALSIPTNDPEVTAAQALAAVGRNVDDPERSRIVSGPEGTQRTTEFADGSTAKLVVFAEEGTDDLAWEVITTTDEAMYRAVVDATSGRVVYRANLTKYASNVDVFPNYPGAPLGGSTTTVDLDPWLSAGATTLAGPYTRTYADLDDSDTQDAGETTSPTANPAFTAFLPGTSCTATALCSWDSSSAGSWTTNREHNTAQVFYFVNEFHDHLLSTPIGFNAASGNFENGDRVVAEALDGASTGPNNAHINNANMSTPPDGSFPRMQMYLFSDKGVASPTFRDVNGGDTAAIVYHEYVHGLSNRLVTDAGGAGALNSAQAGAMGEAWSDWYAMDYLVRNGYEVDTATAGEIDVGRYVDATPHQIRYQGLDCAVGAAVAQCPAPSGTAGSGGFTYGDFGDIWGAPEVHADGEIWAQALWDLRQALVAANAGNDITGSNIAEALITDGMRLSPPEPSFLDMRNAILAADSAGTSVSGAGVYRAAIWEAFRGRGMGFFASTLDDADVTPVENFTAPPADGGPTGTVSGKITDSISGLSRSSTPLGFGGHITDATFSDYLGTSTSISGSYSLTAVPVGTYPHLIVPVDDGYDRTVATNVVVASGATTTRDIAVRRDWAAQGGGGSITSFSGPDYTSSGCGPTDAIDQSQGTGWSTTNTTPDLAGTSGQSIVVQLPVAVTVTSFEIDPSAICGDGASATLKNYTIETSPNNVDWTVAKDASTSGGFQASDAGTMVSIAPTGGTTNVRYVRLVLIEPQSELAGQSGDQYIDVSEFAVYGAPPNVLPSGTLTATPESVAPGATVNFDASSFTDPDSAITTYEWDFDGNGTTDDTTTVPTTNTTYGMQGTFAAKVKVNDFRGGFGQATDAVTVSSGAIAAPSITAPADESWTNSSTVVLSGTAPSSATLVRIYEGFTLVKSETPAGGVWSATLTGVSDGTHTYKAQATDGTDFSVHSVARTVRVDTAVPAAPAISSPADEAWSNSSTVTLSGTAEANSTVQVREGGELRGTTTAGGDGAWTKTISDVSDGTHAYTARSIDPAGNASSDSGARSVRVDTAAPSAPTITAPAQGSWSRSSSIVLSGSAEPGAAIEILEGTGSRGSTTADGTGAWTKQLDGVTDGTHGYQATAGDAAGNVSGRSTERTVRVDTVAPDTGVTGSADGFSLAASEDGVSYECRVDVVDGAQGAWAACANGVSFAGLDAGDYTLFVRATDAAGNVDPTPASIGFTISTAAQKLAASSFPAGMALVRGLQGIPGVTVYGPRSVASRRLVLKVTLRAQRILVFGCQGSCALVVRSAYRNAAGRRISSGKASFSIRAGRARALGTKLSPRAVRALMRRQQLTLRLRVTAMDSAGRVRTRTARLRVRRR